MFSVKLFVTGTLKESYYKEAMEEYRKRLSAYCKLTVVEFKEYKLSDNPSEKQITQALESEGDKIISALPSKAYKIALCVEGKQFTSEEFAKKLEDVATEYGEVCLIVGSSYGLSEKVKNMCDMRLSVSKMTLTHQMLRVWLLEIIYRCLSITKGGKYHK